MPPSEHVEIVAYRQEWPDRFAALGASLRRALGDVAVRIDHIGSTAVPGIAAKPILDVQISVASFEPLDAYRRPLEAAGFVFRDGNPELTKRYFRERPGSERMHIHVRRSGSWAEQLALLFRDYLRTHSEDADRYASAKRQLADQYRTDRRSYTDAKGPLIWEIMRRADQWSQDVGWTPGRTDA